jgi:hypothetical protein
MEHHHGNDGHGACLIESQKTRAGATRYWSVRHHYPNFDQTLVGVKNLDQPW